MKKRESAQERESRGGGRRGDRRRNMSKKSSEQKQACKRGKVAKKGGDLGEKESKRAKRERERLIGR